MAAMHEDVHQRAGEDQQERPIPQVRDEMRPMLGHQIEPADRQKADQHEVRARGKEAAFSAIMTIVIHSYSPQMLDRTLADQIVFVSAAAFRSWPHPTVAFGRALQSAIPTSLDASSATAVAEELHHETIDRSSRRLSPQ
jgi:hypothetical protein